MAKRLTHSAEELDSAVAQAAENSEYIAELRSSLDEKVDKQEGKGLSAEDYTTADKEKLAGLENYDDTELRAEVAAAAEQAALNRSALDYQRKNLMKITAVSKSQNGVTFTVNEDGSVTLNGTAKADILNYFVVSNFKIPYDDMKLSGCPAGGSMSGYKLDITENGIGVTANDTGQGAVLKKTATSGVISVRIRVGEGCVCDNLTFYPMLRYAEISDDTYEPYKPSIEERLAALEEKFAAMEGGT